jgi:hypothetical protein
MSEMIKAASHPGVPRPSNEELIELAMRVCYAIEECGASPELTSAVSLASDLLTYLQKPVSDDQLQPHLMKFDPAYGTPNPYPSNAGQYRKWHGKVAWIYNPWSGEKRHPLDIGSDVTGLLIKSFGNT